MSVSWMGFACWAAADKEWRILQSTHVQLTGETQSPCFSLLCPLATGPQFFFLGSQLRARACCLSLALSVCPLGRHSSLQRTPRYACKRLYFIGMSNALPYPRAMQAWTATCMLSAVRHPTPQTQFFRCMKVMQIANLHAHVLTQAVHIGILLGVASLGPHRTRHTHLLPLPGRGPFPHHGVTAYTLCREPARVCYQDSARARWAYCPPVHRSTLRV